ncbi:Cytochrome c-552 [Methylobacterium crusticola]|uniref:Cytochrome c-552 n=1 Tax=Methylobacterium crusticola TaxID=1697972 RepID=A0ABQ4QXR0_9HYPH|nr:c-type cytochrome [Methylobacterium crusticola]GJD49670.1 Cytochrome c-552 [Methylobacterium crusticola]
MPRCPIGPALAAALLSSTAARAEALAERLAPCLACHGETGRSAIPEVPSLGGQPADYLVTQLYQFRETQRVAPPMNEMAAGLSDDDLRAFADALAALPAPASPAAAPDGAAPIGAAAEQARALVSRHQCGSCHGADLAGRDAIPRIRGQREDYLLKALAGYKSNARPGYDPAMNEVAQGLGAGEIQVLARYLAGL